MATEKWTIAWLCLLSMAGSAQAPAHAVDDSDPDRRQALELYRQHKMPEAADLLEKIVAQRPDDVETQEALGVALVGRAETQPDAEKARADRLSARRALLRAKELGDTSDLSRILLAGIPESGDGAPSSSKPGVDAALKAGEAAFAKADWQAAVASYQDAWNLEPNWRAALYLGDTYYAMKQMEPAGEWFAKAIELEPDREQAYRYWGDALLSQGRMKEARLKYIGGIVADPYNPASSAGMHNWLQKNNLSLKKIPITLPAAPTVDAKGGTNINVDASMLAKPDAAAAWMVYSMARVSWREKEFAKAFPEAKAYRHSLPEELNALAVTLLVYRDSTAKKSKSKDPSLELLAQYQDQEMLAPFILLQHADEGIAQDYAGYRLAHRDKLQAFLDRQLVPPAPE